MNDPTVAIMLGKKLQEQIDLVEKLQEAIKNPDQFMCEVADVSRPATKKLTIEDLKLRLEPKLQEHELELADVLPVLRTIEELQARTVEPFEVSVHDGQKQNPADTSGQENNGESEAPNPTCNHNSPQNVFETIEEPFEVSVHDDQKQNPADTRSEEKNGEGGTYAPSCGDSGDALSRWNFSNSADDVPPGPRWHVAAWGAD
jgi:hypothetical protein